MSDAINIEATTSRQRGDSLEAAVAHLFNIANFETKRNIFLAKYEIDVWAKIGDRTIVIECKNYQNSSLTIRNLIHQWHSKNDIIGAHKIILVLAGVDVKESDRELASSFDMELWNQEDLSELFNLSLKPDELRERLLDKVSLRPLTIAERYRDEITYMAIYPQLSRTKLSDEYIYRKFNTYLRAHILTELQMIETTKEERNIHIELFEGSKKKKSLFLFTKTRNSIDYWNTVYDKLSEEHLLNPDLQQSYLHSMEMLLSEYKIQKIFFETGDYKERIQKIIASRINNAIQFNQKCKFYTPNYSFLVVVSLMDEGLFRIQVNGISGEQANVLNWILTSLNTRESVLINNTKHINYYWHAGTFKEVCDKVYRVFDEFLGITEKDLFLDKALE